MPHGGAWMGVECSCGNVCVIFIACKSSKNNAQNKAPTKEDPTNDINLVFWSHRAVWWVISNT